MTVVPQQSSADGRADADPEVAADPALTHERSLLLKAFPVGRLYLPLQIPTKTQERVQSTTVSSKRYQGEADATLQLFRRKAARNETPTQAAHR